MLCTAQDQPSVSMHDITLAFLLILAMAWPCRHTVVVKSVLLGGLLEPLELVSF